MLKIFKDTFWENPSNEDSYSLDDTQTFNDTDEGSVIVNYLLNTTHHGNTYYPIDKVKKSGVFLDIVEIKRKIDGIFV